MTTRQATNQDYTTGTTLTDSEGNQFTLINKYTDGIWEARAARGETLMFESEARFHTIET